MGRKRDGGVLDDLFELTALLPWWVGVALALGSYVVLHWYAVTPAELPAKPGVTAQLLYKPFAAVFQYILPIVFLGGALASWIGRARRKALLARVAEGKSADAVNHMSWQEFEMLVAEAFRLEGYAVQERAQGGPDGGIDLTLRKASEKTLVQCKQWRAQKVSVTTLRELYGVMAAEGAAAGIVVTSGDFTEEALAFAKGRNLRLIDGEKLYALIQRARRAMPMRSGPAVTNEPVLSASDPACPKCGSPMAKRTAKRGTHAGKDFWGCLAFPKCTGIRPVG